MPRRARQAPGGIVYHALNRAVARSPLLAKAADYAAFLRVWLRHWTNAPCAFLPLVSAADFAGEMGPIEHYANSRGITGRAGLRPSRSGQARVRADLPKLFENSLYLRQDPPAFRLADCETSTL